MTRVIAIGHTARDEFAEDGQSWRLGGTALYAAAATARLGAETTLITRVGEAERGALENRCRELNISLVALRGIVSTTFVFGADATGHRTLRLRARARGIAASDLPPALAQPDAVVFGSIAHELGDSLYASFRGAARVVAAQGYLRQWDADGSVRPRTWSDPRLVLAEVDAVVVSEEDLAGDDDLAPAWSRVAKAAIVVTLAERGARLWREGAAEDVPGFPVLVVDQTGAGDAFAAGLAVALAERRPLRDAVRFANAVASFAVEGRSTSTLADRATVDQRLGG